MNSNPLYFAGRFLRSPGSIGAILPSSSGLRERMFAGLSIGAEDPVLEFGPGTGAFTVKIDAQRRAGIPTPYLGIERDLGMYRRLVRRFPSLDFVLGDVADVIGICRERGFPPAAAVISGVPFIFMKPGTLEMVLADTRACMRSGGAMRTFSYLHCYRTRPAIRLRRAMAEVFEDSGPCGYVLSNLPPAVVLGGRAPQEPARKINGSAVTVRPGS